MSGAAEQGGGFSFGNVGGSVNLKAGGDIVGRDKIATTTFQRGFADEAAKLQFQAQLNGLLEMLRGIKAAIEASGSAKDDEGKSTVAQISQHEEALQTVNAKVAQLPPGKPAPAEIGSLVEATLDRTGGILVKLQALAKTSGDLAGKIGEFGMKYGPTLLSVRHLFGLP